MKKSVFTILTLTKIGIRRYFRDKTAIFFTIVFPLIFLAIFGGIFGKENKVSFHIALINQSNSQFSKTYVDQIQKNSYFKVKNEINTLEIAKTKMSRREIDATLVLPQDFGKVGAESYPTGQAIVYYDKNNESAAQTLTTVLTGLFTQINNQFIKYKAPFEVVSKSTNTKGLSQFDYTFSGLLGFSIIGLGIFGPANVFPELKKQGILKRFQATPIRVWQYFVANVLSQAVIGVFALATMFIVALTLFHLKMRGNYFDLVTVIIFGILVIYGIGLAIGGWAKNERQAQPLANIVVFPLMFLSGTFFPRFLMPEWLQKLSGYLPLSPVIDSVRLVITENAHLVNLGPQLGLMAVWSVVIYFIAFRVFRWE